MRNLLVTTGIAGVLLPALLLWPLLAAPVVYFGGRDAARDDDGTEAPSGGPDARTLTLAALVIEAILGLLLWIAFDPEVIGWQARFDAPWVPELGASISLGVDGLGLVMVLMTVLVMPLALLGAWPNVRRGTPMFGALLLILTTGLVGVFVALDLLLFYAAWELLLVPTYFLIALWGGDGGARAARTYVLFTLVGSLLMLVAIVALRLHGDVTSLHLDDLLGTPLGRSAQGWAFGAFLLAFGVKSALVPFHTWLPDAQRAAPTVAAVALGFKVGTYAILRFAIPLFPAAAADPAVRLVLMTLGVVSIVYGALLAMAQDDLKRLVAYTSVSHLGFIILGTFAFTQASVQGAAMVMLNHGVTTSALFLLVGMLQDRHGSVAITAFGGLARTVPLFSVMLGLAMFSTMGLPGTNGFIGEFLVLLGSFSDRPPMAIVATTGVVLAAAYGLRVLQRVLFEALAPGPSSAMRDLSVREAVVMGAFAVAILWFGIAPQPVLSRLAVPSANVVDAVRLPPAGARPLAASAP